jgi:HD-like signal output (HDOD) protein
MNEPERLRILFVDDEARILQGLQRMLRPLRDAWDMQFVESGELALRAMAEASFDVVVSDMRMPGMSGAELLNEVMKRYPATIRLILSGQADLDLVRKTVGPTHQYLSKPCDTETLKATLARAFRLRKAMADDRLRALVGSMDTLPSLPSIYRKLVTLVQSPNSTLKDIGLLMATDMGMSAKVLQLVNSAFFGAKRQVTSPADAVSLLGIETIQALTMSVHAFVQFDERRVSSLSLSRAWSHSMGVANLAKRISQAEEVVQMQVDEAFMAGMLHDAGTMILAANLPDDYERALVATRERGCSLQQAEQEVFGATHAEVGAYLLGLWGISDPIVEAVAFHHQPAHSAGQGFTALTAVHVANALHHAVLEGPGASQLDAAYLQATGRSHRVAAWCELAKSIPRDEASHA